RCFGCGAQGHVKQNCPHRETTCRYCGRRGHLEAVCQDKFMGLGRDQGQCQQPRRQQISATSTAPFSLFPNESVQIATSTPTSALATVPATPSPPNQDFSNQIGQIRELLDRANAMSSSSSGFQQAGRITHFAHLALTVDSQERWMDFLITNLGGEDIILGLPWLQKVNPEIDWEKGRLSAPQEATLEESESAAEESPIHRIRANHKTCRAWVKAGILEEQTEEVWCAAGFTYSQQLAEEAN
ncbi:hypothetical protein F5051DRAFT_341900, partial [Lentinula edodes]